MTSSYCGLYVIYVKTSRFHPRASPRNEKILKSHTLWTICFFFFIGATSRNFYLAEISSKFLCFEGFLLVNIIIVLSNDP